MEHEREKNRKRESYTHNSLQHEVKNGQVFFHVDESMRIFPKRQFGRKFLTVLEAEIIVYLVTSVQFNP